MISGNGFLWSCVWQSTVCVLVGLGLSFALRRWPARAHRVLLLAIMAAVVVPLMSAGVKQFGWGLLAERSVVVQQEIERATVAEPMSNYESAEPATVEVFEVDAEPVAVSIRAPVKIPWGRVFLWGWITASVVLICRVIVSIVFGVRLLARGVPLECVEIERALGIAKRKLGIVKRVWLYCSQKVHSPVIWCWQREPVLLLPMGSGREGAIDWVSVFCHELGHWKRWDHVSGLLAEVVVCVFPWNPLFWWAKRRLVRLSEQACDDWVVSCGQETADYADSLLGMACQGQMAFAPAVVSSKRGLGARIRRILEDRCGNPRAGLRWVLSVSLLAVVCAGVLAFVQTRPIESSQVQCKGKVVDPAGKAVAGAKVAAYEMVSDGVAGNIKLLKTGEVQTKADGAFDFKTDPKPERGRFMGGYIVAIKEGLALGWSNWDMRENKKVKIRLREPSKLGGVIVDEAGRPIVGAEVCANLMRTRGQAKEWLPGISPMEKLGTITDDKGKFEFNNIPAGCGVDLLVTAEGRATVYTYQWGSPPRFKDGKGPLFKAGQTNINVVLPAEGQIEGKIVDKITGEAVVDAKVAVVATFSPAFYDRFVVVTDEEDAFSVGGLQNGEYLIRGDFLPKTYVDIESGKTKSDVTIQYFGEYSGSGRSKAVEIGKEKPSVWLTVFPKSPIRSLNEYRHWIRTTPAPAAPLYKPVAIPACDFEVRRASDQQRVARIPFREAFGGSDELTQSARRRIGRLGDGEYLVALSIGDIRCSNVSRLIVDSDYDASGEPTLSLIALEAAPGGKLPFLGIRSVGPTPPDAKLTNESIAFPTLIVDGVERVLPTINWLGPVARQGSGKLYTRILNLDGFGPAIEPGKKHTVKAIVGKYESASVVIPADNILSQQWDKATKKLLPIPPPMIVLKGKVTGLNGKAADGYKVALSTLSGSVFKESTKQDGTYQFVNIPPGSYSLVCHLKGQGQPDLVIENVQIRQGEKLAVDMSLHHKYILSGTVSHENGSPAANIGVWLTCEGRQMLWASPADSIQEIVSYLASSGQNPKGQVRPNCVQNQRQNIDLVRATRLAIQVEHTRQAFPQAW